MGYLMVRRHTLLLGILLSFFLAGNASAEPWAYDLAGELMSPYCPGRTLASCPSPQAAELVQWMVLQESAGSSQDEVVAILIERFGEEILGAPPAKGITLWAYVFPILGFVVGGGLAVVVLRRIVGGTSGGDATPVATSTTHDAGPSGTAVSDDELARLVDADLAARG
jgi:cytochrome c-type biogenesis protein CcmH/NrfF